MYSTINNISSNIIICSCGSKTTDMTNHLKSRKHLILQRIKDKENIIFGTITDDETLIKEPLYKDASTQTEQKNRIKNTTGMKRGRKTKNKLLEPEPEPEPDETIKTENIEIKINYTPEFIINFDSEN